MNDVIGIIADDFCGHAEDDFQYITAAITRCEKDVDGCIACEATLPYDECGKWCSASSLASGRMEPARKASMTPLSILLIFASVVWPAMQ